MHGESPAGGVVPAARLGSVCASLGADVLCLQEVDRDQARSGGVDQAGAVAESLGAAAWRFEAALVGEPGGQWRAAGEGDPGPGEAGYGVAIVSRLPVRAWQVVRLAAARVRAPVAVPGGRGRFILLPDEPRVAVAAEVEVPWGRLRVATTHLSFVPGWNVVQLRRLTRALAAGPGAPGCVLLGDLNLPGPVPALATGWRSLGRVRTYPAPSPWMQLDHALGHGPLPAVVGFTTRQLALSDHRAVVVELAGAGLP